MARRSTTKEKSKLARKKPRLGRLLLGLAGSGLLVVSIVWYAVHHFDWAGPLVANSLRSLVGDNAVAKLEDFVYGLEDSLNRLTKKHEAPKAYWHVPEPAAGLLPSAPAVPSALGERPDLAPAFHPANPGPALKEWAAPGDGEWLGIADLRHPEEAPRMYKTLLHPDKVRSWAEVFVVAVDLTRVALYPVLGTQEPQPDSDDARILPREGKIPLDRQASLLAAFNGGFMTEHGGYGMKFDGTTVAKAKPRGCVIACYRDSSMRIASWQALASSEPDMLWFRQTPECMWEGNKLHPGLQSGSGARKWGATVDGETIIRRSAIGLNSDRSVLYVAITNHTSARVLADGLHHAGASDVAQLDVNWSYPKFVTFEPVGQTQVLHPIPLAPGFEYSDDEYLRKKQKRDFFFMSRKESSRN